MNNIRYIKFNENRTYFSLDDFRNYFLNLSKNVKTDKKIHNLFWNLSKKLLKKYHNAFVNDSITTMTCEIMVVGFSDIFTNRYNILFDIFNELNYLITDTQENNELGFILDDSEYKIDKDFYKNNFKEVIIDYPRNVKLRRILKEFDEDEENTK